MKFANKLNVNSHYTRSINLERDADSLGVVQSYIPTSRALRTLGRMTETFHEQTAPRAWSLVGPYGSGKSSFSIFSSKLLDNPRSKTTQSAIKVLADVEDSLATQFKAQTRGTKGFLSVLITGSPEPMTRRIVNALSEAAGRYWSDRKGKKPTILKRLASADAGELSSNDLLALIKELQIQLEKAGCPGILLIIDELGKFLEYEARHYGANDIFLLQTLAEHACSGGKVNLYLFVLLHQSFEQYAKGLGENLRNEWSKVQGRFEEVPFLESAEQTLRVVSAAFDHNLSAGDKRQLKKAMQSHVDVLARVDALPGVMTREESVKLFSDCYPLHPISAILLPLLCQKIAQNERTLFSYLGSQEDFGVQSIVDELVSIDEYIYPDQIFDYFIANQSAAIGDYLTHRRWVEVVTAMERLGDASELQVRILKTIGILNIVGAKGGFKPSKDLLSICFPSKAALTKALKALEAISVITFRKFNGEYRVWQGSDFDLEDALQEEVNNLGIFSLAEELNRSQSLLPIVARRYSVTSGTLRYFRPIFVDAKNYIKIDRGSNDPRIIFFLAGGQDDEALFQDEVREHFSKLDLIALCKNGAQLREAVAECEALKRVQINRHELNADPVAKREYEDRLSLAEQAETFLLQQLVEEPDLSQWYCEGRHYSAHNKRQLQNVMSTVLEAAYDKSPIIDNELINRDRPSSQAAAARNQLLYRMLSRGDQEDLGIEKFPPEKAIYRSLLKATGLHKRAKSGEWQFYAPTSRGAAAARYANLYPAWQAIDAFLDSTEAAPKSFVELNAKLMSTPYGIKAGLLPILYVANYIINQHEIAIYEGGRYRPEFTEEMIDRFVKRPDEFAFQRFRIKGLRASLFRQYSKVIHGDTEQRSILDLAKPLATFMSQLPEYTRKTRRGVGKSAQAVRTAFELSKSPEALLFDALPEALGFEGLSESSDEAVLGQFAEDLTDSLRELKLAHSNLVLGQRQLLARSIGCDENSDLSELRINIVGLCSGLEGFTVDRQGVAALLKRISNKARSDEEWLENILMFLGHKPTKSWLDSDQDNAEHRLNDFARRIIDLQQLSLHTKKRDKHSGDFDVYLLRSVKTNSEFYDEVVVVDEQKRQSVQATRDSLEATLRELGDNDLKLAALAQVVDTFLAESRESSKARGKPKVKKVRKMRAMSES